MPQNQMYRPISPNRFASNRRWAAAVLLAALASTGACSSKAQKGPGFAMGPVTVRAVAASSAAVPLQIAAIGNVEAISTVDVKARVAGQIKTVNFQEGQDVHAGETLFELDQEPFLQTISESEANLARDIALVEQSKANIARDQAQLKNARAQADRALALQKEGINSREQTETVVTSADTQKASLTADEAALNSAEASVKADRSRIDAAKLQLSYTIIKAPISGRAGAIQVKAGNLVKENDTALVTLLQTTPVYVSFSVPQQQLAEVRRYNAKKPLVVQAATAGGTTERGSLSFIDNTVDMTTGTIKLKAQFANNTRQLWPGEFVNVSAQLSIEPNRVVIPSQTIQTGPDGKYVWVKSADDTVSMRPVNVLRPWGDKSVIGSGLQAGETVISEGQLLLAPGSKVRVLKNNAPAQTTALAGQTSGS
jgi:membrane fusion protein, multidrug efflux system